MKTFKEFLTEAAEADGKLKHLQHVEDLAIDHGHDGFKHAVEALHKTKEHVESSKADSSLTTKIDGCVHADTLVVTKNGPKKISELTNEDQVKCYDIDLDKYAFYNNSTPVSSSGVKKFVKVTFENGSELICTADHPILIKEANEFQYVAAIDSEGLYTK